MSVGMKIVSFCPSVLKLSVVLMTLIGIFLVKIH